MNSNWTRNCLKYWSFRTLRPNVRWRKLQKAFCVHWWLATVICTTLAIGAKSDSSTAGSSSLAQALNHNPDLIRYWAPLEKYLTRYGYLQSSLGSNGDNLRTEEKLRESIKTMQRFGNIPPTGRVDAPTLELLKRRRCGMPDLMGPVSSERVRRFAIQGQKWPYTNLTWSIKQWPPNIDPGMVRRELSNAFKVWSDASKLEFEEIRSLKADIVVSFLRGDHKDGYPFDGRGVVLAHAFFPGEGIGGDAHFDAEEPWVHGEPPPGTDGVSLFAVAAHEFGHSLGLSHSSVSGALMNPFYQTIKDNFQLPHDDTFGIQSLYGARYPTKWEPLSPYTPRMYPTETTTKRTRPVPGVTRRPHSPRVTTTHSRRPHVIPTSSHPKKPHTCNTTFDAISIIRRELFIFKEKYFWRLNNHGLMRNYPVEINRFWYDSDLTKVDAVYERPIDTKIVFFSGKQYWLFNGNVKERGYPRPLTDLGLPPDLEKLDAAMVWGYNGKTYLFSGSYYWRYDESEGRVELDYPRKMDLWRGVPYNLDAAFQHSDGKTYFFKGRKFWQFNDQLMKTVIGKLDNINQHWFGCPSHTEMLPSVSEEEETSDQIKSDTQMNIPPLTLIFACGILYKLVVNVLCAHKLFYL